MGIFDFITKQFVDVIDWVEGEDGMLAYRFPMTDREIQNGAKLTVRETQAALFVNEGKIADVFGPGLYTLNTQTLPVLTNLMNWDKAFASPFKSDVYFFSTRHQLDQKWGTPTPITIRDKEFGPIRIRLHGIYSYKLEDVKTFYQKVSGSRDLYRTADMEGQLRSTVLTTLGSLFGTGEVGFVDMAASQVKFSEHLKMGLTKGFASFGLALDSFLVQSVSLPDELQKRFDERAGMQMVGDLRGYAQFQAAQSIPLAASNEGGVAGAGAGLGAGLALGQTFAQALTGGGNAPSGGAQTQDGAQALEKLHDLLKKGILTQAEFDAKKAEILRKM